MENIGIIICLALAMINSIGAIALKKVKLEFEKNYKICGLLMLGVNLILILALAKFA